MRLAGIVLSMLYIADEVRILITDINSSLGLEIIIIIDLMAVSGTPNRILRLIMMHL